MAEKAKIIGYVVVEYGNSGEWEQPLCLEHDEKYPSDGLLDWCDFSKRDRIHLFPNRASARDAIERTESYTRAFGYGDNMPRRANCKVRPVEATADVDA